MFMFMFILMFMLMLMLMLMLCYWWGPAVGTCSGTRTHSNNISMLLPLPAAGSYGEHIHMLRVCVYCTWANSPYLYNILPVALVVMLVMDWMVEMEQKGGRSLLCIVSNLLDDLLPYDVMMCSVVYVLNFFCSNKDTTYTYQFIGVVVAAACCLLGHAMHVT